MYLTKKQKKSLLTNTGNVLKNILQVLYMQGTVPVFIYMTDSGINT